jgi:glycosyltransferase involved in cell wall biosynthesis
MTPGFPNPVALLRLTRILKQERPDVLQTWLYHSDLMGGLAAKLAGGIPVAWGIRQTDVSSAGNSLMTWLTARLCARLSGVLAERIICCSEAARRSHGAIGYAKGKMIVIPNGSDLDAYRPNPESAASVRKELGIPPDAVIVGLVGRFHPQKDHQNFAKAAGILCRGRSHVQYILCGQGITAANRALTGWLDAAGIRSQCHLLGTRDDMPRLTAAFDIGMISSFGEGFPNVISEAMSCGVPCVVTDVGDASAIVGDTGRIVPSRNAEALAAALRDMVDLDANLRRQLGAAARRRIVENFNLPHIAVRYQDVYEHLA